VLCIRRPPLSSASLASSSFIVSSLRLVSVLFLFRAFRFFVWGVSFYTSCNDIYDRADSCSPAVLHMFPLFILSGAGCVASFVEILLFVMCALSPFLLKEGAKRVCLSFFLCSAPL